MTKLVLLLVWCCCCGWRQITYNMYSAYDYDARTIDPTLLNFTLRNEICNFVINSKTYYLNNSRSKFINIGLNIDSSDFATCIELGTRGSGSIILSEEDWSGLQQHQGIITGYFFSSGYFDIPLRFNNFSVYFEKIDDINVIKIKHDNNNYIYLGSESVCKLWDFIPLIEYRLDMLKKQQFDKYYNTLKTDIGTQQGDLLTNVFNKIAPKQNANNENISTLLELLIIYPHILEYKLKSPRKRSCYEEVSYV